VVWVTDVALQTLLLHCCDFFEELDGVFFVPVSSL